MPITRISTSAMLITGAIRANVICETRTGSIRRPVRVLRS